MLLGMATPVTAAADHRPFESRLTPTSDHPQTLQILGRGCICGAGTTCVQALAGLSAFVDFLGKLGAMAPPSNSEGAGLTADLSARVGRSIFQPQAP